jgi:hypothetical protein
MGVFVHGLSLNTARTYVPQGAYTMATSCVASVQFPVLLPTETPAGTPWGIRSRICWRSKSDSIAALAWGLTARPRAMASSRVRNHNLHKPSNRGPRTHVDAHSPQSTQIPRGVSLGDQQHLAKTQAAQCALAERLVHDAVLLYPCFAVFRRLSPYSPRDPRRICRKPSHAGLDMTSEQHG